MKIISFAWTTPALLAGVKTCTRRYWNDGYAQTFRKGDKVAAYDRLPRVGGKQVAMIQLTEKPYQHRTSEMTESDYKAEGLAWMEEQGIDIRGQDPRAFFDNWRENDVLVWVIEFRVLEVKGQ